MRSLPTTHLFGAAALVLTVSSAQAECYSESSQAAQSIADQAQSWQDVYSAFARFGVCDDGAIAEGFSDSIARLLAHHWDTITSLSRLAAAHPKFRRFVLRHIDSLMSPEQARAIADNARRHCPVASHALCLAITVRIDEASHG